MCSWTKNDKIYDAWLDLPESEEEDLKRMLCVQQFGYEISNCKLVWLVLKKHGYPLVLFPELSIGELETEILPKIVRRHLYLLGPKTKIQNWKGYDALTEGTKLEFDVTNSFCCFQ